MLKTDSQVRTGSGNKKGKWIVRAGSGNKKGKGIVCWFKKNSTNWVLKNVKNWLTSVCSSTNIKKNDAIILQRNSKSVVTTYK